MTRMLKEANLVVSAWDQGSLVGVARSLSDFSFCTYLSDLAVAHSHQRRGIGRELVRRTLELGGAATLYLFAAPAAVGYYPKIGFSEGSGWLLKPASDS